MEFGEVQSGIWLGYDGYVCNWAFFQTEASELDSYKFNKNPHSMYFDRHVYNKNLPTKSDWRNMQN